MLKFFCIICRKLLVKFVSRGTYYFFVSRETLCKNLFVKIVSRGTLDFFVGINLLKYKCRKILVKFFFLIGNFLQSNKRNIFLQLTNFL